MRYSTEDTVAAVPRRRRERGWELHIDGVGVTQTRSLAKAEADVADYLDLLVGEEAREIVVIPESGCGD